MIEQIFRPLRESDFDSDNIKRFNEDVNFIHFTHKMKHVEMDYQVIIAIKPKNFQEFSFRVALSLFYRFSRKKFYEKVPRYLSYAEKIYFLNEDGKLIKNEALQVELYKIIWAREFLFTGPFRKSTERRVKQNKFIYEKFEKIENSKEYSESEDELKNKISEQSKMLDKSDTEITLSHYLISRTTCECHNISHEISHHPDNEKMEELREKLIILRNRLENIKKISEKRDEIWLIYEPLIIQFYQQKKKNRRYICALLHDVISLTVPILNSKVLNFLLIDIFKPLIDNFTGHIIIQRAMVFYQKELDLLDEQTDALFNPDIPMNKIMKE